MSNTKMHNNDSRKFHVFNARQHLKHPIPYAMEVIPIGKTLTDHEWHKFCEDYPNAKDLLNCERNHNGKILFVGEGSLDALIRFQEKFKGRFHLKMICGSKSESTEWLELALQKGIKIQELHYYNGHGIIESQILH